ncbi:MAG: carboxyl transferase domain-containing protein [Streptosporangiaceae bacterium]
MQLETGRCSIRGPVQRAHQYAQAAGADVLQGGQVDAPANFVLGTGRLADRKIVVGGDDFTIRGGAADAVIVGKQIYAAQLAHELRLPLVRLVEGTGGGLLIGSRAEQRATIRHGVRAITAVYQATVPGAEVILRRVFGVSGAGLTNRHRLIRRWAWPSADWGSLPVEGGTEAAYRAELGRADDPAAPARRHQDPAGCGAQSAQDRRAIRHRGDHRPARDQAAVRLGA